MSALSDTRTGLAELLADSTTFEDVTVLPELPEKATPPFVVVGPGDPYVSFEGAPFGYRRVHLAVTFVSERGTNDVRAGQLDEAIIAIVETIEADGDFMVVQVEQPGSVAINGQSHLAVSVTVMTEVAF